MHANSGNSVVNGMLRQRAGDYERVSDKEVLLENFIDFDLTSEREASDRQFAFAKRPFPAREIALGVILLAGGLLMVLLGVLNLLGLWENEITGTLCARRDVTLYSSATRLLNLSHDTPFLVYTR